MNGNLGKLFKLLIWKVYEKCEKLVVVVGTLLSSFISFREEKY